MRQALGSNCGARLEAGLLLRHVLGVEAAWLIAHDRDALAPTQLADVESLLARRLRGEPVAYILGRREFYGRDFRVSADTLIPRPETEHLIDAALARLPAGRAAQVLDIGTGSGCLAITLKLERPTLNVVAVDLSLAALAVARDNGERLGAEIAWLESDLFSALGTARFHLVVSNPPYVAAADPHLRQGDLRFEPVHALASGADGLEAIRAIVAQAPAHLTPGGWLLLEHGWDQGDAVARLLNAAGFEETFRERDLAGRPRLSGGRTPL